MLPGVELARRRRVHYHGDVAPAEHHHHAAHAQGQYRGGASAGGVTGPALAARIRLEEKLRGAGPPSPSRYADLPFFLLCFRSSPVFPFSFSHGVKNAFLRLILHWRAIGDEKN